MMRWFDRPLLRYVTLAMRVLQLVSAATALSFVAASFQGNDMAVVVSNKKITLTMHYGGPTVNFALVVTYSAAVYVLLWIAFVHVQTSVRVPAQYSIMLDAIFTVMLLSAGCAVAASDYVRYCDALAQSVHCSSLKAGAAFCFIAFVAFFISVAWGAWIVREQLSDDKLKTQSHRRRQQQERQRQQAQLEENQGEQEIDVLERSPSSDSSNYLDATYVC